MPKKVTDYISKTPFEDITVLRSDYLPSDIEYRNEELEKLARDVFAAPLNDQVPENLFIYGQSGTGKTLCIKYWLNQVQSMNDRYDDTKFVYVNCKRPSSPPRLIVKICKELSDKDVKMRKNMDYYMDIITEETEGKKVVIILDEVDRVLNSRTTITGDDILYNLLRSREEGDLEDGYISVVGVSNKMNIKEELTEGTRSSFGANWMSFDPYNKEQICGILQDRAVKGIKDFEGIEGVLDKIASYVAKLNGDVRTAIDILRHSGKIAEKNQRVEITFEDVDEARYMVQKENIMEDIKTMTDSQRLTYLALIVVHFNEEKRTRSNIKKAYDQITEQKGIPVPKLTKKQIGNYLKNMVKRDLLDIKVDHNSRGRPSIFIPAVSGKVLLMLGRELLNDFEESAEVTEFFTNEDVKLDEDEKKVLEAY